MDYAKRVDEIWCHHAIDPSKRDDVELVRYATLAASSHNTQPWLFRLHENAIEILPDLTRRCPAVDPDDHHLYASLGCAAENLLLAARAAGLAGRCSYDPSTSGVRIEFEQTTPSRSALFEAIPQRECCRTEYDGTPLTAEERQQLEAAGSGEGVSVLMVTDDDRKARIAEYVTRGNVAQFCDSAWARELKHWIRFNGRAAARAGDGLYGPAMGSPDVPRWFGRLAMRVGFSAGNQNRKDRRQILSSSAVAVIHSESNDKPHWIEAGRCYQRLALQATVLGLRTAFINQPVEVSALRPEFAQFLGIGDRRPDLVVRIGRGPEMPRSLRRPVAEVIT
ncbi:Acg family FMN-binding oxidoreductase [Wenzhouxiangella sp. EGI_FJ10305]|uniref:Acg family FMN-binding oxidoreductase n=1 Tax=Wenzhouxiangella sp. EGI_FJ10305 TaxID=3243768 RepID=UPI0035E1D51B